MNKERIKGIVVGFLLCALLSTSVMVMATPRTETRQITYGVRVNFNGQLVQFNADNQPFVMGGRTFLPLRAMADLLGLPVDFNPATNTAYVGNRFAGQQRPLVVATPHFDQGGNIGNNNAGGSTSNGVSHEFQMGGTAYQNVLWFSSTASSIRGLHIYTRPSSRFTVHNLNGDFRMLTGYVGRMDGTLMGDATLNIIGDGAVLATYELRGQDLPIPVSVFVEGIRQLRIEVQFSGVNSISRLNEPVTYGFQAFLE